MRVLSLFSHSFSMKYHFEVFFSNCLLTPMGSALRVCDPSTVSWSFTRFEVRSGLSDGSSARTYASVSSRAHAAVSLVVRVRAA